MKKCHVSVIMLNFAPMQDFKRAFHLSLPVLGAYWFLGATYGLLAANMGYAVWIPLVMAMVVFSGSVEFLALTMLLGAFQPLAALMMALMVGARHLFYAIAMLDRWRGASWHKPFLIFWMSDETFAINYASGGSFCQQLWLSVLDYAYWITGMLMGYVLGSLNGMAWLNSLKGLDFVVTAMFVAIFMDDYLRHPADHSSAWLGIVVAAVCLVLFGSEQFIVPTMGIILLILYVRYKKTTCGINRKEDDV